MPLRLIEFVAADVDDGYLSDLFQEEQIMGFWRQGNSGELAMVRVLVDSQFSESISDLIEQKFSSGAEFRLMILSVEATLPMPEPPEDQRAEQQDNGESRAAPTHDRISREELYEDVAEGGQLSWGYLLLVLLSTVVVGIGMVHDDIPVIIGGMVIAPLLGPNVALALGTTLGDLLLIGRSIRANGAGVLLAFVIAVLTGAVLGVDPEIPAIAARTEVSLQHILLALASGCAGALAFTRGTSTAVIGVMVAVALLPPLVACGMLVGSAHWFEGQQAFLLLVANVICVNLSGVMTFLFQGIRPRSWWEADRAKRATRIALLIWAVLLAILIGVILLTAEQQ